MREIWLVNFNFANFKYARKLVRGGGITSRISLNDKMIKTVGGGEGGVKNVNETKNSGNVKYPPLGKKLIDNNS